MAVSDQLRVQVGRLAQFACEFCGVQESDAAGELTIDHYRPQSEGGEDVLHNLLYCCFRCNLYKADDWPSDESSPKLWNPREESSDTHWALLENGELKATSPTGEFTIRRMRLNRPQLVAYRRRQKMQTEQKALLKRHREIARMLDALHRQQSELLEEERKLLEEQQNLLSALLDGRS